CPALEDIGRRSRRLCLIFPYVAGLLVFQEGPVSLVAFAQVRTAPDLLLFDAHGFSAPRRFGLACPLSAVLDKPGVGVAKSRLIGYYEEPRDQVAAWRPLADVEENIGAALRTRAGLQPICIVIDHRGDRASELHMPRES